MLRQDRELLTEFMERDGWEISVGAALIVEGSYFANAERAQSSIEAEGSTEDEALRRIFDQVHARR